MLDGNNKPVVEKVLDGVFDALDRLHLVYAYVVTAPMWLWCQILVWHAQWSLWRIHRRWEKQARKLVRPPTETEEKPRYFAAASKEDLLHWMQRRQREEESGSQV